MELLQILTTVIGALVTLIVGWLSHTIKTQERRVSEMERRYISYEQMEKFVELKQAPLYVLLESIADDMHQLRKLMERQYEREREGKGS